MGVPEFEERTVELADGAVIDGVAVSMGNPHFVIVLLAESRSWRASVRCGQHARSIDFSWRPLWEEIGEEICYHPDFPDQTNVEFVHILGSQSEPFANCDSHLRARSRSNDLVRHRHLRRCDGSDRVHHAALIATRVIAPGGAQTVAWDGPGEKLYLTGPAR